MILISNKFDYLPLFLYDIVIRDRQTAAPTRTPVIENARALKTIISENNFAILPGI
jgi:hypothetical protein